MVLDLLFTNIVNKLSGSDSIMSGGKINTGTAPKNNFFIMLLVILFLLLIKGLIVYILYNNLMPKLIYSVSEKKSLESIQENFRELSYMESVMLVIFTNTLFSS